MKKTSTKKNLLQELNPASVQASSELNQAHIPEPNKIIASVPPITSSHRRNKIESNFECILKGIPSSPGIAIGKAVLIRPEKSLVSEEFVKPEDIPSEIEKFDSALLELTNEFYSVINQVKDKPGNIAAIIETNLLIVNDASLKQAIHNKIQSGYSKETALITEIDAQMQYFKQSKDKILRERGYELEHIKERILGILRNRRISYNLDKSSIVVAQFLTPTDLVKLKESGVIGIVTEVGGVASHTSLLARSFEIPAIISVGNATEFISDGVTIIIDGYTGTIICNPQIEQVVDYREKLVKEHSYKEKLGALIKLPALTKDNHRVKLMSNIDFVEDIESSILAGADGIGLYRTEYLVLSYNRYPDEDEQYKAYKDLAYHSYPNFVTIRAFDVGSDKYAIGLPHDEVNPALGFRGIRFLLSKKELFISQIKSVLRASKNKNIKFMLPMITTLNEVIASLNLIKDCKNELRKNKISFDQNMPVGVMIETPAAAFISDVLSQYADFFSIGTNDLTQYTLAADRANDLVGDKYDSFHPAVLKMIKMTIDTAKNKKIPVSICGELASHSAATALLVGMGIDELSVTPTMIPELKSHIRDMSYQEAVNLANNVLAMKTKDEIRQALYL